VRHWPIEPIEVVLESRAIEQVKTIVDRTRDNIETLAKEHRLYMGLTAGRDSRMILGCARNVLDRMTFVTFNYKDPAKFADVHIAKALSRKLKLAHQTLELNDPPRAQKDEYLYRVGYCNNAGKACDFYDACGTQLKMDHAWLTGYGGEVGRAFYWGKENLTTNPSAEDLVKRMHLPASDSNLRAVQQWLEGVPRWVGPYALLDLMYLELRLGCWASPQQYGTAPFAVILMPFSHRDIYAAILALPVEYRRQQFLARDVIKLTWPEALDLPFQEFSGLRRTAQRIVERFKRLKKRLTR
jgi:tetrahydromethanopterin S-methyltransferase subunit F